jgi:hypothetical protein
MRRFRTAIVVAIVLMTACSGERADQLTAPLDISPTSGPALSVSGLSSDSLVIESLISQLYGNLNNGDGPLNSALTRFRQVAALYTNCNLNPPTAPCDQAGAQLNDYLLITDLLSRYKAGGLNPLPSYSSPSGTGAGAAVTDLVNLLLGYAGLDASVCSFGAGVDCAVMVYQPGSVATILTTPSGQAGINLPAGTGTVTRPTVISVSRIPDPNFRLSTSLDQYPYRYIYSSSSGQGIDPADPFLQDVTVEICLENGLSFPAGALDRLVLAHDVAEPTPYENIQLLPSGTEFLPACEMLSAADAPARTLAGRAWRSISGTLAGIFAPAPLSARALATGTGTVGTTKNLSPFGAVDPIGVLTANSPAANTAPQGGTVPPPSVRVVTPSQLAAADPAGPGMPDVLVTFSVTAGDGCFATPCTPASPITVAVNTDAGGYATAPAWTVGVGANTVTAAASIPCAAPVVAGSVADCGAIVTAAGESRLTFSATGMPPTKVVFNAATLQTLGNLASQVPAYAPGTPFNVTVLVQDGEDPAQTVPGSNASVTLTITSGGILLCPSGCTRGAVNGVVTFTGVYVTSVGTYQLTATSAGLAPAVPAPDGGFRVVAPAGSAANIVINAGNNQTAAEGTTLGSAALTTAPSVRVTDPYGNVVGGAGVTFAVASGAGGVGSPSPATNALGIASTTWSIVAGTNTLNAFITSLGTAGAVSFTATGTPVTKELLSCGPSAGNGDELSRAFYWTKPGAAKTLKQVTLYLASNDAANVPTPYVIELQASADSYGATPFATSRQTVYLRGSASQNLATQFVFPTTAFPSGAKNVAFQFKILSNPNGARLFFAKGPASCTSVTETVGVTPLPLSSPIGKGVGIRIFGS